MDDSGDLTSEIIENPDHNIHISKNQRKRGRPKNILWEHFNEINPHGDGHKGWEFPFNIKQELLQKFPIPNQKRKTKLALDIITGTQPQIDNKFLVVNNMDPGQEEL
ncbi:9224_t:CDS:2, partial [Cetraspora pellucida]